ncbi:MAG: hypothetical protein JWM73_1067 [Solirubrobacterales bacterium]|jgi:hypothetical protein|nr:hypothetical protein [Solirubrobacterales bacterium]
MKINQLSIAALGALAFAVPAVADDTTTTTTTAATTPTAQEQCRTERDAMGKAVFAQTYGTNANRANAFGKCVSKRDAATETAQTAAKTNAAQDCKAEQAADPAAFDAKYATNKKKTNGYGKCVSGKAKAKTAETVDEQVTADVSAAKTCKAERKADPAAFKAKYGTNGNKSNAFGKCVSAQAKAQQDKPEETTTPTS